MSVCAQACLCLYVGESGRDKEAGAFLLVAWARAAPQSLEPFPPSLLLLCANLADESPGRDERQGKQAPR
jgi:hypothetical protein